LQRNKRQWKEPHDKWHPCGPWDFDLALIDLFAENREYHLSIRLTQFYNKAKNAEIVDQFEKIDVSLLEIIDANTNGAPLSIKKIIMIQVLERQF
jgi:hypothetical protein